MRVIAEGNKDGFHFFMISCVISSIITAFVFGVVGISIGMELLLTPAGIKMLDAAFCALLMGFLLVFVAICGGYLLFELAGPAFLSILGSGWGIARSMVLAGFSIATSLSFLSASTVIALLGTWVLTVMCVNKEETEKWIRETFV